MNTNGATTGLASPWTKHSVKKLTELRCYYQMLPSSGSICRWRPCALLLWYWKHSQFRRFYSAERTERTTSVN